MSDNRPAWLKPYALVAGRVPSAPLDLPQRMERVYAQLKANGWTVVVKSLGTDFSGPLGLPVPREQPVEIYLFRPGKFTAREAEAVLGAAIRAVGLNYSPIGAWLEEIAQEVIVPTVKQTVKAAKGSMKFVFIGVGVVGALFVLSKLGGGNPYRRR